MTQRCHRVSIFLPGVLAAMLAAGCNDPASTERIIHRQDNLTKTVGMFNDVETGRPRALAWAVDKLREQHERDLQNSAQNPSRINGLIQDDIDDWHRLQPAYNQTLQEKLKGDPDNIRRTAPQMAW